MDNTTIPSHGRGTEAGRRVLPDRIAGLDIARALAVIGMVAVHVGPTSYSSFAGRLYAIPHGRASILFVLVAGIGVSLLAASRAASLAQTRLKLAWIAAVLLPLGLAMQALDHHILVVLQSYAALFLLGALVVALSDRWILALAAAFGITGPLVFLAGRIGASGTFNRSAVSIDDKPHEIVMGLLLAGPYPLITWAAPFLLGVWLGRRDLRATGTRLKLIGWGAAAIVAAIIVATALRHFLGAPATPVDWTHIMLDRPHSQMPLWLIGSTASAVFVLGLALIAADILGRALWPLAALGQLALTAYLGHVLMFHFGGRQFRTIDLMTAVETVAIFTVLALALAVACRSLFSRGPVESLLQAPWWFTRAKPDPREGIAWRDLSGRPGRLH